MSRPVSFPAAAGAAYAAVVVQAAYPLIPENGATFCPFRVLTGIPCPGCGMGHALVFALRGDFAGSWHSHPLGIPLLALWTAWLGWGLVNLARSREFSTGFFPALRRPAAAWSAFAIVMTVYAVRFA